MQRLTDYNLRGCMNPAATAARLAHRRAKPTGFSYEARHLRASEFRAHVDGDTLVLTGYASVFDRPYEVYGGVDAGGWSEVIDRGAFAKTLAANPDVHLLINHDGLPLARTKSGTLHLSTDQKGLRVKAELDRSDPDVQRLEPKMVRGDINEMSFAFRVKGQVWSDGDTVRRINEVDIDKGDVSVVNFGANPATSAQLAGVR
jgi:HK97 family phage prohead protease